jgi:hypothetical protein
LLETLSNHQLLSKQSIDTGNHPGHILNKDGIKPNPSKIEVIKKILILTDTHQISLKRFLGLTGYCRKFIKNYAKITDSFTKLLRKNTLYK